MAKLVLLLVFVCFQYSRSEELPAAEQFKLDLDEDEIPFNNQTAPDIEVLDGADEDQWYTGADYDWSSEKLPQSELNNTNSNALSILQDLIALAEMLAEDSDEENSSEWDDELYNDDDDYSYWDILKDWFYTAQYKESVKNKDGKEYEFNTIISLLRPRNPKDDKIGHNWGDGKMHPAKRFTSV